MSKSGRAFRVIPILAVPSPPPSKRARPTSMTCRTAPRASQSLRPSSTSGRTELESLDHPQLPARFFRHALWGPHRLVDDVDVGLRDAGNCQQVVADVGDYIGRHRAAEGGEGHLDVDSLWLDPQVLDEAQVHDLDPGLGREG